MEMYSICFFLMLLIVVHSQINLTVYLHLEATESLPLTCTFKAGSVDLCTSPVAHFPSCSCNFPEKHLSSDSQYFHSILQNCVGHITFYRLSKKKTSFFLMNSFCPTICNSALLLQDSKSQ